jgi:uncharacterized protein (DUF2235 family)
MAVPDLPTSGPRTPGDSSQHKKIIICLDGTNDQIGESYPTNVGKTYEMLKLTDSSSQIAYYDPGVGTLPASTARGMLERKVSRIDELAFGIGIKAKLVEAYTWLMQHYQFGDEIYVFGFSRGAYTARALVGMLNRPGLLRPGSENLVPYAVREYATNKALTDVRKRGIKQFADAFCWGTEQDRLSPGWRSVGEDFHESWHAVPIKYLGIWDTVEASGFLRWGVLDWPYTHELFNAERIRHAVSIDEWRRPYHEFLVDNPRKNQVQAGENPSAEPVQEVWFAGVHSDVGGTYLPDYRLAKITLKWVLDGVIRELALREKSSYSSQCVMTWEGQGEIYKGKVHGFGLLWKVALTRHRPIPDGAHIHRSVELRRGDAALHYDVELPEHFTFVDSDWENLVPANELDLPI